MEPRDLLMLPTVAFTVEQTSKDQRSQSFNIGIHVHYIEPIASLANVMLRAMMNDHHAIVGLLDAISAFWKAILDASEAGGEDQKKVVSCDAGSAAGPAAY